jgi:Rieske Fe-S protein
MKNENILKNRYSYFQNRIGGFMDCKKCLNRRKFIRDGLQSFSAIVVTAPLTILFSACSQEPLTKVAGGNTAVIPTSSNNVYTLNFTDYPQLANAGGSVHATVNAASGSKNIYITRVSSNSASTVSTVCTHQGCTLNAYDPSSQQYFCACHGSIFSSNGNVVAGPATTPLPSYVSTITASAIEVTIP